MNWAYKVVYVRAAGWLKIVTLENKADTLWKKTLYLESQRHNTLAKLYQGYPGTW